MSSSWYGFKQRRSDPWTTERLALAAEESQQTASCETGPAALLVMLFSDRLSLEIWNLSERYFFTSGGKCANIFCTPLSRFLMFLSALLESVSLEEPRQISVLVFASNRSTTRVPTW